MESLNGSRFVVADWTKLPEFSPFGRGVGLSSPTQTRVLDGSWALGGKQQLKCEKNDGKLLISIPRFSKRMTKGERRKRARGGRVFSVISLTIESATVGIPASSIARATSPTDRLHMPQAGTSSA